MLAEAHQRLIQPGRQLFKKWEAALRLCPTGNRGHPVFPHPGQPSGVDEKRDLVGIFGLGLPIQQNRFGFGQAALLFERASQFRVDPPRPNIEIQRRPPMDLRSRPIGQTHRQLAECDWDRALLRKPDGCFGQQLPRFVVPVEGA